MKKATKPATKGAAGKPAAKPAAKPTAKPAGRKPIYVTDPNNKRLLAYNDSLKTYELDKKFKKELHSKLSSAKTKEEYDKAYLNMNKKWSKAGLNPDLYRFSGKVFIKRDFGPNVKRIISDQVVKKPVQPIILLEKETKTNVAPKGLKKPSPSIKVERTVKLPSGIRDVKYDTQKGTVLVNLDGTQKSMPRKDFDKWVNQPENRKMFNEYRSKKAKKK